MVTLYLDRYSANELAKSFRASIWFTLFYFIFISFLFFDSLKRVLHGTSEMLK